MMIFVAILNAFAALILAFVAYTFASDSAKRWRRSTLRVKFGDVYSVTGALLMTFCFIALFVLAVT